MLLTIPLLTAALVPQGTGPSTAPVVINEFSYDDTSTDDREFVEIYNRSGAPVDISGWVLDSEDQVGPNTAHTVPAATTLAVGGYYVFGSSLVPNVNQIVGTTNLWENSQESLTLRDTGGNVVDTLVYEANKGTWPTALPEGEGVWGNFTSIDGLETSWSRLADGYDSDNNGRDFRLLPSTPGATNSSGLAPFVSENFDSLIVTSDVPNWAASFFLPKVIDPTVVDTNNVNAIPASPQGGNAMTLWDPAGGGDTGMYPAAIGPGQVFDALVYFDAVPEMAGENETWSIGFGATGTYSNSPDPSGAFGFTANGNTGVAWIYQVTDAGGTLYLVDHNDGGWPGGLVTPQTPPTVVTSIPIQVGVNDGWRRLRLEVVGLRLVIAQFDGGPPVVHNPFVECCAAGCFPCGNGTNCPSECSDPTASLAFDFLYVGYREGISNNALARPPTIDDLLVSPSSTNIAYSGTAAPTTVGTPVIAASSPPIVGNSAFAVEAYNLTNTSLGFFLGAFSSSTLNLQPFGAQPGAAVLNQGTFFVTPAAGGSATLSLSIPNNGVLLGTRIFWQIVDEDPALSFPVKLGNSNLLETTLGG